VLCGAVDTGNAGAWIGNLILLDPYNGYFATPTSDRITKPALIVAGVLVVAALTIDWCTAALLRKTI
jgi:hypothetical protein